MSQRFIRCPHCHLPHDVLQVVCPSTGKPIDRRHHSQDKIPVAEKLPSLFPQRPSTSPAPRPISTLPPGRSSTRDLTGKKIGGKYVVRAVLGEGGMGTVFEAEHITIGRSVAVKVLHPNQARKKDAVKRFHQEARAAGAIGHPEHLRGLRPRHAGRRQPLPRHGEARRRDARRSHRQRGRPAVRRRHRRPHAGALRARRRAREGHRPPRHQARERLSHEARRLPAAGEAPRLRRLEDDRAPSSASATRTSTSRGPAW